MCFKNQILSLSIQSTTNCKNVILEFDRLKARLLLENYSSYSYFVWQIFVQHQELIKETGKIQAYQFLIFW